MKIAKVELKAFRAYKELESGTFDFTRQDGTIADFIAIHAPNGFGKTSFFDGVEWCITNNIYRFLRKNNDNRDLAITEQKNLKHKQLIIRNKDSEGIDGFVKVTTTGKSFERKVPDVPRKGGRDFKFDEKDTIKEEIYFRDVLLAQDWIDAFLKEDKPEERYKKFITYFGDSELDKYYKNLVQLISLNDAEVKVLKKQRDNVQAKLRFDLDSSVLENVNGIIDKLISKKEELPKIDLGFNEVEEIKLNDKIQLRIIQIENDISALNKKIQNLNEGELKLGKYLLNIDEQEKIKTKVQSLKLKKKDIDEKEKISNSISKQNIELLKLGKQKQSNIELRKLFTKYSQIVADIKAKEEETIEFEELIRETKKEINKYEKLGIENTSDINRFLKQNEEKNKLFKNIPKLFKEISERREENLIHNETIAKEKKELLIFEQGRIRISEIKSKLRKVEQDVQKNDFSSEILQNEELADTISDLKIFLKEQKQLNDDIKTQQHNLYLQKNLNTEIKEFITQGVKLVKETQTSSCPLCLSKFDNAEILLDKIASNPALNELEKKLLEKQMELNEKLNNTSNKIIRLKRIIIDFVDKQMGNIVSKSDETEKKIKDTNAIIKKFEGQRDKTTKEINALIIQTRNLTNTELEAKIKFELETIAEDIKEKQNSLERAKKGRDIKNGVLKLTKEKLKSNKGFTENIKLDDDYQKLEQFRITKDLKEPKIQLVSATVSHSKIKNLDFLSLNGKA